MMADASGGSISESANAQGKAPRHAAFQILPAERPNHTKVAAGCMVRSDPVRQGKAFGKGDEVGDGHHAHCHTHLKCRGAEMGQERDVVEG